mgnify:FL=1
MSGKADGRIVGRFHVGGDGRVRPLSEKIDDDFRHSIEFILRVTSYSESDLLKKDFLTFLKILKESEKKETDAINRIEKEK